VPGIGVGIGSALTSLSSAGLNTGDGVVSAASRSNAVWNGPGVVGIVPAGRTAGSTGARADVLHLEEGMASGEEWWTIALDEIDLRGVVRSKIGCPGGDSVKFSASECLTYRVGVRGV